MHQEFTLSNFLPYLLTQAAQQASHDFSKIYKKRFGLHRTDWRVLAHLGEFGALSAREICDRAGEHKTRVSRAVVRLQGAGYLKRETFEADRRREVLTLTTAGDRVYAELTEIARAHDARLLASLQNPQSASLKASLLEIAKLDQNSHSE